jgi:hypothetical protein
LGVCWGGGELEVGGVLDEVGTLAFVDDVDDDDGREVDVVVRNPEDDVWPWAMQAQVQVPIERQS